MSNAKTKTNTNSPSLTIRSGVRAGQGTIGGRTSNP